MPSQSLSRASTVALTGELLRVIQAIAARQVLRACECWIAALPDRPVAPVLPVEPVAPVCALDSFFARGSFPCR